MKEEMVDYEICLSFAGEQRNYVEEVARELKSHSIRVFYDNDEQVSLWGKDLYSYLDQIYRCQSQYCVLFVSEAYAEKRWTNHERKSAQARAFEENSEYILPARFDDAQIPGLPDTIGYIDLNQVSPKKLATFIRRKLGRSVRREYLPPVMDRLFERVGVEDDPEIQRVIQEIARRFFYVLQEMTDEERDTVLNLIRYRCDLEYPDNIHVHADTLRRRTGKTIPEIKQILSNLRSLGFQCSFQRSEDDEISVHGEILGETCVFELNWLDLRVENDGEFPELVVACSMVDGATEGFCDSCGAHFLESLNFSQLSHITASIDSH